jgi:hypothetical protein
VVRAFCALASLLCTGCPGTVENPDAGMCPLVEELDCEAACARYPGAIACSPGAVPVDHDRCLNDCALARAEARNRAALFGCIQQFTGDCAAVFACSNRCQSFGGGDCDPAVRGPCTTDEVCDAATRKCIPIPLCMRDRDCEGGYACLQLGPSTACYRSCSDGRSVPEDSFCQVTHTCDEMTFQCVPWPCARTSADVDCQTGCAHLAAACQKFCPPMPCQVLPTCVATCEQVKASGDVREISAWGCLQHGHSCMSFAACESICEPPSVDGGARD